MYIFSVIMLRNMNGYELEINSVIKVKKKNFLCCLNPIEGILYK